MTKSVSCQHTGNSMDTEQLRNDLDEVEALTSRVRDSIVVDLSSTRRYSPLLYEYYKNNLELAKSIQSTYNVQCSSAFDTKTFAAKSCQKDYVQTVHNPEYLTIKEIDDSNENMSGDDRHLKESCTSVKMNNSQLIAKYLTNDKSRQERTPDMQSDWSPSASMPSFTTRASAPDQSIDSKSQTYVW